jgi:uncharacterized membrane protein YeaQ/YmgE (transglycosylase-associated protein family)
LPVLLVTSAALPSGGRQSAAPDIAVQQKCANEGFCSCLHGNNGRLTAGAGHGIVVALQCENRRAGWSRPIGRDNVMPFSGEGIIVTLIIGLVAGWLASKIVSGTGLGLIGDIVVGIVGAFIAAWVFPKLGIALGTGIIREIIDAAIGAIILLVVIKLIRGAM